MGLARGLMAVARVTPVAVIGLAAWQLSVTAIEARAATPAVLIDAQLQQRDVNIQSVDEGMISYFDAERRLQVEPLDRFVQIRRIGDAKSVSTQVNPAGAAGQVELIDGQRLKGSWVGASKDGQSLIWKHEILGQVSLDLSRIQSVMLPGRTVEAWRRESSPLDTVRLINGDQIAGFVTAVDARDIEFQVDGQKEAVRLPLDRVIAIRMSNPKQPEKGRPHWVELTDGSRVAIESLQIGSDQLIMDSRLAFLSDTNAVSMSQVARVIPGASKVGVIELSNLPIRVLSGGHVFGLVSPPRTDSGSVELHAPVVVEVALPQSTARLGCTIRLATGGRTYTQEWAWADCRVTIHVDRQEIAQVSLDVYDPAVTINVPTQGRVLTIEVDEAANGPIMDRVVLEDAMLLVEPTTEEDSSSYRVIPSDSPSDLSVARSESRVP